MAFEKGNTLAGKSKLFDQALRRAIAQDDGKRLRECAESLLNLAAAGEAWAVKELADRLDGRAVQTANVNIQGDPQEMGTDELAAEILRRRASEAVRSEEAPSIVH